MLTTRVPNMTGMSAIECIEACLKMNLNCKIDSDSDIEGLCVSQSVASGTTVYAGDIIYVTLSDSGKSQSGGSSDDGSADRPDALPPENHDEEDT